VALILCPSLHSPLGLCHRRVFPSSPLPSSLFHLRVFTIPSPSHILPRISSPTQADNTSANEFPNLACNRWVLHMILERGRVVLRLLEDAVHDWVLKDAENLKGNKSVGFK
jgi:hypothetical protein